MPDRNGGSPDGKYIVCDMGGSLYRIPMSGANRGKPEKIYGSQKMMATVGKSLRMCLLHLAVKPASRTSDAANLIR